MHDKLIFVDDFPPERGKCQGDHLEVLFPEGYSNDSDAQHHPPEEMAECNPDTPEKDPQYIQHRTQATGPGLYRPCCFHKRPECKSCQFETLNAEWYPDDGDTHENACNHVFQRDHDTAKQ